MTTSHLAVLLIVVAVLCAIIATVVELALARPEHQDRRIGRERSKMLRMFEPEDRYNESGRRIRRIGRRSMLWMYVLIMISVFLKDCTGAGV
jgi:hypothetical protein